MPGSAQQLYWGVAWQYVLSCCSQTCRGQLCQGLRGTDLLQELARASELARAACQ